MRFVIIFQQTYKPNSVQQKDSLIVKYCLEIESE